jgi:hypothetical protein
MIDGGVIDQASRRYIPFPLSSLAGILNAFPAQIYIIN